MSFLQTVSKSRGPYQRREYAAQPTLFMEHSNAFIASKLTQALIQKRVILENIPTTRRLYQYLNWTMRINKVAETMAVMEDQRGRMVMVINVELHDRRGDTLYALCVPNLAERAEVRPWTMVSLLTTSEITNLLSISPGDLPFGARAVSTQFGQYRAMKGDTKGLKAEILSNSTRKSMPRYLRLKCITTGNGKGAKAVRFAKNTKILTVDITTFYEAVRSALGDPTVSMIPIVTIKSGKRRGDRGKLEDFSVDYMLTVQVHDASVGVVYRDGLPVIALMDRYDIINKAILCDASFDVRILKGFRNHSYDRLKVVDVPNSRTIVTGFKNGTSSPSQWTPRITPRLTMVDDEKSMTMNSRETMPQKAQPISVRSDWPNPEMRRTPCGTSKRNGCLKPMTSPPAHWMSPQWAPQSNYVLSPSTMVAEGVYVSNDEMLVFMAQLIENIKYNIHYFKQFVRR